MSEAPTSVRGMIHRCAICGLVSTDGYGFCWGYCSQYSYTACPACQNSEALKALMQQWEAEPKKPAPISALAITIAHGLKRRSVPPPSAVGGSKSRTKRKEVSPEEQPLVQRTLFDQ